MAERKSNRYETLWIVLALLCFARTTHCGLFPDLVDLAEFKPITASSICGLNGATRLCKSSEKASSVQVCEENTCEFKCCANCRNSKPIPSNIGDNSRGNVIPPNGEPRNGSSDPSFVFEASSSSNLQPRGVPYIEYLSLGFTLSLWMKQKAGNKGTLFVKAESASPYKVIFQIEIQNYKLWFYYQTSSSNMSVVELTPLQSQSKDLKEFQWHVISVSVVNTDLSYYIDGIFIQGATLTGPIVDGGGLPRVGQTQSGGSQFEGFMQDIFMYDRAISNREIMEALTGNLEKAYIATNCRCPPGYPKISTSKPAKCAKNIENAEDEVFRLATTAHPSEYMTDADTTTYWQSAVTDNATVEVDLLYQELQIFFVIMLFYGPPPEAILIERSRDRGSTYKPWQYFASDCQSSFGMENNGNLVNPDSINCIQYQRPLPYSSATIAFKLEKSIPARPFGAPCSNLYCSTKFLDFIKASNVRIQLYNHTLIQNEKHRYFALKRVLVTGRCECHGHAQKVTFIKGNSSSPGRCRCECDPSTFTQGEKCESCLPMYNNKAFLRGTNDDPYPCVKCECNNHASACYYNSSLDPSPASRTVGGGGVCINCLHNTAGQFCHVCRDDFFREPGKSLSAVDVCSPCQCTGPGVETGKTSCARDDSTPGVIAGQCECKQYTQGRQCDACKPGFYDLKSSHSTGCVTCGCNTAGTVNRNASCDQSRGQCYCKSNVTGRTCDTCESGFYGLRDNDPSGCRACECDPFGTLPGSVCDAGSGQCRCKAGSTGLRCHLCEDGYHSLDSSGCKTCNCSTIGAKPGLVNTCDKTNGQCYCKTYVEGKTCDRCKTGYYNLTTVNQDGCSLCSCDPKGIQGSSLTCEVSSGNCTCKKYVREPTCGQCMKGYFNLSSSNPEGCQACNCNPKGTLGGDRTPAGELECSGSNGKCACLTNVQGLRCDQCVSAYYWNPSGYGCSPCNCDASGSLATNCNSTGYCQCKPNIGGRRCDRCMPGSYGGPGSCKPCNCNMAGSLSDTCDDSGKCNCKPNVQGDKCDTCKDGTQNLQVNNDFGCSGVPSQQPAPVITVSSSRRLDLAWSPPDNPNGIILRYELYRNGTEVYRGVIRGYNDTNLQPDTLYIYYIITYTEAGSTRSANNGEARTLEDAPESIDQPSITDIQPRSVKASWTAPNAPNGILTEYRLLSVNNRNSSEIVHFAGLSLSASVDNLRPFTNYSFTVVACNSGGCRRSVPTSITTLTTAPDFQPMPTVSPQPGGTVVHVTWDEPPVPNGNIYMYEIYMRGRPFSGAGTLKFKLYPQNNPEDPRNTSVSGLTPFTEYEFRVVTYTAPTSGDTSSEWRRQRTAEGVPSGESAMSPSASPASSSSVQVTWSPPQTPNGIIERYIVKTYSPPAHNIVAKQQEVNVTSLEVVGLRPYSDYKFTVSACNSYACTGPSSQASARTLPAAPEGQGEPEVIHTNSTSATLNWTQPQTPNGPLPPAYNLSRAFAAMHYPPPEVIAGAHFPGNGYYKFPGSYVREGTTNEIELWFRTQYPDGLILFLSDSSQADLLAVVLREGKPWFIFDCQTGPAAFTVSAAVTFDDNQWHRLQLTRKDSVGTLTVDGIYTASGSSSGASTFISMGTGVYIGGLPTDFIITRSDPPAARVGRYPFIGCIKSVTSQGSGPWQWEQAVAKEGVDPVMNACPVRDNEKKNLPGVLLRGGGYIALAPSVFNGGNGIFVLSLSFRTYFKSGLLLFTYGPSSHVAVSLVSGQIKVRLQSPLKEAVYTSAVANDLCDGFWHRVEITGVGNFSFVFTVDGVKNVETAVDKIAVTSPLYIGGIPLDNNNAVAAANKAGLDIQDTFGGCIRDVTTDTNVLFGREVLAMRNSDLDGCVSNKTLNVTQPSSACAVFQSTVITTQNTVRYFDTGVQPFTDYLYRVSSFQAGTSGSADSAWMYMRSGQGDPQGLSAPTSAVPLKGGRTASVTWNPPTLQNGLITHYVIRAYDAFASGNPVDFRVSDPALLNVTITNLTPYTTYRVQVAAYTQGGSAEGPGLSVTTLQAAPEEVPTPTVKAAPFAFILTWTPPAKPNGVITLYNLTLDGRLMYSGLTRAFNISGLEVYNEYTLQLLACTAEGCTLGPALKTRTGELPPEGLKSPSIVVQGNDSLHVQWDQPTKPNGKLIGYEVLMATVDVPSEYRVAYNGSERQLSAEIDGLITGTLYYVRVKAFTNGGGTVSNASTARTVSGIPSGIPAPRVIALSPSSLLVIIRDPLNPNGVITRYEIYEDGGVVPVLNATTKQNYTATEFPPYSRHTYRVHMCTIKGCNPGEEAVAYTQEIAPNGTVHLTATLINPTTVRANWSHVAVPNGRLFYNLMVSGRFIVRGSITMETELRVERAARVEYAGREFEYAGLLPYNRYEFFVNASNTVGYILSNIISGTTGEAAPDGIRPPNVTVLNSTAVMVSWQPPALPNGVLLGYELRQKSGDLETVVYRGNGLEKLVTDLKPYTLYQFRINANTSAGPGFGNWTSVVTDEAVPGPLDPPRLVPDSTDVLLEWNRPVPENGVIVRFVIFRNGTEAVRIPGNVTRHRVTGLKPFTFYTFAVNACTTVGCSRSGDALTRTLESVPEGLSAPRLTALAPRHIKIQWDTPTVANGIILYYSIDRREVGDVSPTNITSINASLPREYVDTTASPVTTYQYRVVAFTTGGGTPSPYSNITTGEGDPEGISPPTVRALSPFALHVVWTTPTKPNGHVIRYIVRVLETGSNNTINDTSVFEFNVTGLMPYIEYSIVISACTAGDCGSSQQTKMRTLGANPSDQPSPTAKAVSATALRVEWDPPSRPNGEIRRFELFRMTLDDPTNPNFTATHTFVKLTLTSNIAQFYDDTGLGIYSLHQYKVTVFTSEGNSTSLPSLGFRTGPSPPLSGPNVTAKAFNHTSVLVTWSPPVLSLLRGAVKAYTVSYEHVTSSTKFRFGTVTGNVTSLVVTQLKPSSDYRFWVKLDNGAGEKESDPVTERTQDGAPEGFAAPILYSESSTVIRVSWTPPTTPNGQISAYKIYANNMLRVNASANQRVASVSGLSPYTQYTIMVEVCTVYTCTRSPTSTARTQPDAPSGLAAPQLTAGPNTMRVDWAPPAQENGIMRSYQLYRRRVFQCPTSPPPTAVCTYVECTISDQLCGATCYNPAQKVCCDGVLHDKDARKSCCDSAYLVKNSANDVCCGNQFYVNRPDYKCCYGNYLRVPSGSVCCQGNGGVVVGFGDTCCSDTPYFVNNSKVCVCGSLYDPLPARKCCGGRVVASAQVCCGDAAKGNAYDVTSGKECCGLDYVTRDHTLCCEGALGAYKVYNYSSAADKAARSDQCCKTNRVAIGLSCCNDRGYNASYQVCADKSSSSQTGCGNGAICNSSQALTARCNRCDFDSSSLNCGFVKGYYAPTLVTPTARTCASEYVELLNGVPDPNKFTLLDVGLSPHTLYEYYVVGYNDEGNTTSPTARNRTLMASPEGLTPPIAIPVSATSIKVTWKPPTVLNGVLKEYVLTRINQQSNQRVEVYRGLNESFLDTSGLEPFTGYMYQLQACTTECAAVLSAVVFTGQSRPTVVSPPGLEALNSTSIRVTWTTPPKPNGVIIAYNVTQVVNGSYGILLNPNDNGLAMSLIVINLRPYTNYTFKLTACTNIGCADSPPASVLTMEAAPESMQAPRLTPRSSREVEALWREPAVPNGIVVQYSLYRSSRLVYYGTDVCTKDNQEKDECIFKDKNLTPNTLYNYSVTVTTGGGNTSSPIVTVTTPESSPEGIPLPRLTARSANEIYAEWDAPTTPNGVIIAYGIIVDGAQYNTSLVRNKLVTGLTPYTRYAFQVTACTAQGCGIGDRKFLRTLEAPPSGQGAPTVIAKEWNVVTISWSPPSTPNGIITSYEVQRRSDNEVPIIVCLKNQQTGLTTNCLDSGGSLRGYTVYRYLVYAINGAGRSPGPYAEVRTMEGPPSGVKKPAVTIINATAVTATWDAPQEPNGIILHYELRYQVFSAANVQPQVAGRVAANVFNLTVNVFKPNTNYEFLIAAINSRHEGVSAWALAKTKEAPPQDLKPLQAERISGGTSMRLYWEEPGSPNGRITEYNIYKDGIQLYRGTTLEYTVTRLTPYTAYEFQLEACTAAGCTRGQMQTLYSAEVTPTGLAPPTTGFTNDTAVLVTWRPPAVPNGVIQRYDVIRTSTALPARRRRRASSELIIYSTNNTNASQYQYLDTNLSPYTRYQYKVRALNKGGQVDSDWITVDTKEAPPGGVATPTVSTMDAYRLNVSWTVPTKPNGIIQYYLVYRNGSIAHKGEGLSFLDSGKEPYTAYSYTVSACTGGGCTEGGEGVGRTAEAAPTDVYPPSLTPVSAYAIRIEWRTPGKPNGIITEFEVYEGNTRLFSGLDKAITSSGRKPYTLYSFILKACTRAGCSSSTPASARTLEAAPGIMAAPVATVGGASLVRVQWSPPSEMNGVLLYYLLTRDSVIIYNGTDLTFNDYTVAPYKVYSYKVKAVNSAGHGPDSPAGTNPATNPGAPDNVATPKLTVLSANSIRVQWTPPGKPNGVIERYFVLYNNLEVNAGLDLVRVLTDLDPFTLYAVRIKACTTSVACSTGTSATARTLEAPPSQQGPPVFPINEITANSILITWSGPVKPNGNITRFEIERRVLSRSSVNVVSYGPVVSVFNGTDLQHRDPTVSPYTEYEYRVTSFNSAGSASSSWVATRSLTAPPAGVPAPTVVSFTQTSVTVAISPPQTPNGEIRRYVLVVGANNISSNLEMQRLASGLQPYTQYPFLVLACTDAGCTASPTVTIRTAVGTPSEFSAPRVVSLGSRTVVLAWDEPSKPNGVIQSYEVLKRVSCNSCEMPANGTSVGLERSYNVTGLAPYVTYDFIIRVYNTRYSGMSDIKAVITSAEDPVAVGTPPLVNVTGFHVSVDWSNCFTLNGPLDEYLLLEDGIIVYSGRRAFSDLPNRPRGVAFSPTFSLLTIYGQETK
ncbi:usherin isoform X2 [Nematostella vectensis]|uniref:usherin isoform X2 n=1 Tax=Nematostella vectensis TaxID=45351 RepID=UPI0020777AD6|nr:usherin isoform X2 [Nematostella vectensis]